MSTLRAGAKHVSKPRGRGFWLGCLLVFLGLPLLVYYGYCWGLWGWQSLLLQYLFQCSCPPTSEDARYPDRVDVIVSACSYQSSKLSPSGRLLYVQEETAATDTYLWNLETNERTAFTFPEGSNYFLTDELVFHTFYGDREYIWDITTGKQYPIKRFADVHSEAYVNGQLNLGMLAEELRSAAYVFLINSDNVIALVSDFDKYPDRNFNILRSAFPGRDTDRVQQFLLNNNIAYYHISDGFPSESLSPDGRFIARADGIYLADIGLKIVEGYSARGFFHAFSGKNFSVRGWIYDSSGVIYSKFLNPCLIESTFLLSDEPGCFFEVPQPLIKLKVPKKYLLSSETP